MFPVVHTVKLATVCATGHGTALQHYGELGCKCLVCNISVAWPYDGFCQLIVLTDLTYPTDWSSFYAMLYTGSIMCIILYKMSYWHCSQWSREQILWSCQASVCLSVCLSVRPIICPPHAAVVGLHWALRGQEISQQQWALSGTAHSSKCEQCQVYSCRRRLNTDLLCYCLLLAVTGSCTNLKE